MTATNFAALVGEPVPLWAPAPAETSRQVTAAVRDHIARGEQQRLPLEPLVDPRPPGSTPLRDRKNQTALTDDEWRAFVDALKTVADDHAPAPSWQDIVQIHVDAMSGRGMQWGVHHMNMGMPGEGRNFLAWHRKFVLGMEDRLRRVDPAITIPYWNWVNDHAIPSALADPDLLNHLGVTRYPSGEAPPTASDVDGNLHAATDYLTFQGNLELGPHNTIHRYVGGVQVNKVGTMATSASPKDPVFWLHHAMIDNLWAHRQQLPGALHATPPNGEEILQPPPIIVGVAAANNDVFALGYTYS